MNSVREFQNGGGVDLRDTKWGLQWTYQIASLSVLSLLLVLLYRQTAETIVALWRTSTYSHGFLIVPISLLIIWSRRERLRKITPQPALLALPCLVLTGTGWLLGHLATTDVTQEFCLTGMIILLAWGTLGSKVTRALLLPLGFLMFAVPAGEGLIPKLQDFSAWFAVKMLDISGVPVLLEGRLISVPSGQWEVAEACSGIRYLMACIAVGTLFAALNYKNVFRRAAFIAISAVVPIIANAIRVYGIVLLAHLTNNRIARGIDHLVYGWIFFACIVAALLFFGSWWREALKSGTLDISEASRTSEEQKFVPSSPYRAVVFAAAVVIVISLPPIGVRIIDSSEAKTPIRVNPPERVGAWRATSSDHFGWSPSTPGLDESFIQDYELTGRRAILFVAWSSANQHAAKVVTSGNSLYDGSLFRFVGEDEMNLTLEGEEFRVRETLVRSDRQNLIIWNWYWIDGTYTSNDAKAKLLLLRSRLSGKGTGNAFIAVATENAENPREALATLLDFTKSIRLADTLNRYGSR